jgi:hypothetical protein
LYKENKIPEYLKEWLKSLTDEQADEMWLFLDGCDNMTMIDVIMESHPDVVKANEEKSKNL